MHITTYEEDSYEEIKEKTLKERLFGPINEGSLRMSVLNLMICGTSGTFFWYPVLSREFGYFGAIIFILAILALTYYVTGIIE
jgi:hypothetical protein